MTALVDAECAMGANNIAERVFAGELLVFRQLKPLVELVKLSTEILCATFGASTPQSIQHSMSREAFLCAARNAQRQFNHSSNVPGLMCNVFTSLGMSLEHCYRDRLKLRIMPSGNLHAGGTISSVHTHRDTWGSHIYQQINWWAPVTPLHRDGTLTFFPRYWSTPIANSSHQWRYDDMIHSRRHGDGKYPIAPKTVGYVDTSDEIRVVIQPGDLLCFSGAHLHGGLPNTSGLTRFNIETRTINLFDIAHDRKAPNVDCQAQEQHPEWFSNLVTGMPLLHSDLHSATETHPVHRW